MQISKKTITLLKNFSNINPSILIKKGNVISTISQKSNVIAQAIVEEEFPQDFAIYSLSRFFSTLSLFENSELQFNEKFITISDQKQKVKYTLTDPSMIIASPYRNIKFPEIFNQFEITGQQLTQIIKTANVLQLKDLHIHVDEDEVVLESKDMDNPTSDRHRFVVREAEDDEDFSVVLAVEMLSMVVKDYTVRVAQGIVHFHNEDEKLDYWIASLNK